MVEISSEPTTAEKLRGLPWDVGFSATNSVFSQFTFFGSVFVLFLDRLTLSKSQIGTLLSLLPFTGLLALFIAPTLARVGYKRAFLFAWGARTFITMFLLFTPLVQSQLGSQPTLIYVTVILAIFAIWRSVGMTARLPWVQEFVPDTVRGKFSALSNMASQAAAFVSIIVAGYIVERTIGLTGFIALFALGVAFGVASVWSVKHVPGGAPTRGEAQKRASHRDMLESARDRNFVLFLVGVGLMIMASGPLVSFIPLFMQEEVGLGEGQVVWLQNGTLLGAFVFSYMWGWLADRYGSKPVMMSGVGIKAVLPILWLAMPRNSAISLYVALVTAFLQGVGNMAWFIGATRLRFVAIVPPEHRASYQALYFAFIGIVGGFGQIIGGRLLDASANLSGEFLVFTLDSYSVLFFVAIVLTLLGGVLLRRARADSPVTTGEFAAMFFRGNPFMALESLIRYRRARSERQTVSMTERLGRTASPLTVDELLESLADPRFNVRLEAVLSIARRAPDERLMEALVDVLAHGEPALRTMAAWALGRIGDQGALEPLRQGLDAEYRSVRAHCARALGTLRDEESTPLLLERLENETDLGLQLAYASALGKLQCEEATDIMLLTLRAFERETARSEVSLALARIIGDEHPYIHMRRQCEDDAATTLSQAVTTLKRTVSELEPDSDELLGTMERCADALAREDMEQGIESLCDVIEMLPKDGYEKPIREVLEDCADSMELFGEERIEYVVLALHAMETGLSQKRSSTFARMFR